ncbi:hypothetical protein DI09_8p20 [Mitosporidium daphniae]|uniref:Uncharacterized protein n=1 Tax=Mitosporidium daphniae TaxID=1485682 RepID=A0A098VLW0_9MICR|nr:uncharacterized protein DI09_8p20 [Mitosporidium daphniae]KGG50063.1 hypothetical protein DI09_8p20 [Mitosporidium daphniae]|eukprot:XP_013236535.1 uncharacterized protein DI09_8p20 [Mitosporidium daphniae]
MLNPTEQELVHIAHHTLCVEGRSYAVFPRSDKETGPHTSNPFIMRKKYFSSTRNCRHKQYERKAGPNFERHEGSKRSGHPSYFKAKFDVPVFFIAQHVGMKLQASCCLELWSICSAIKEKHSDQIWRPYLQPSFRRLRTNTQSCIQGSEIPKKGNIDRFLLAKKPRWCISTAKVMRMQWLMQEYVISEHNSKFLSLIAKIITTCTLQGRVEKISKDILLRSIGYFSSYLAIRSSFARLEIDFYKKLLPDATKSFISVLKLIIAIVKIPILDKLLREFEEHCKELILSKHIKHLSDLSNTPPPFLAPNCKLPEALKTVFNDFLGMAIYASTIDCIELYDKRTPPSWIHFSTIFNDHLKKLRNSERLTIDLYTNASYCPLKKPIQRALLRLNCITYLSDVFFEDLSLLLYKDTRNECQVLAIFRKSLQSKLAAVTENAIST